MRRLLNQLWFLFVLPPSLVVALFLGANTESGRGLIAREIEHASGGRLLLSGLGGLLPLAPRVARLELRDADGIWLEIEDTALRIDGGELLRATLMIDTLSAGRLTFRRPPVAQGTVAEPIRPPLPVRLRHLRIEALDLDGMLPGAPVLTVDGSGHLRGSEEIEASLLLSTANAGLAGSANLHLIVGTDGPPRLDATGELALTEAPAPIAALLGPTARFGVSVRHAGDAWRVGSALIEGAGLATSVQGRVARDALDLTWTLNLPDLGLLAPGWSGRARARGLLTGPPEAPALSADLDAEARLGGLGSNYHARQAPSGWSGRLFGRASARLAETVGTLDLTGDWAGQPLAISLKAGRSASGDLNLLLHDSDWAGIAATGNLRLRTGAPLPQADLQLRVAHLTDLAPLLSRTAIAASAPRFSANDLAGRLSARIRLTERGSALIEADGTRLALPGAVRVETLRLNAEVTQPPRPTTAEATVRIDGLSVGAITGQPALTHLEGQARLTGTASNPSGTMRLRARDLRLTEGAGRGIIPAQLDATATFSPSRTRIDATAETGPRTRLRLSGHIDGPLFSPGALALRADGRIDTALLDPLLTGGGRQLSGQATVTTAITGTLAAPRLDGSLRLADAALHDRTLGLALTDIDGTLALTGDTLRVEQLTARAGPGRIRVTGRLGVLAPGLPVDLRLVANDARPIQSDPFEVYGDADLRLHGALAERPTLAGELLFSRVALRLPERLPASIVTLDVRERGQRRCAQRAATPRQAAWQPELGLDLLLSSPGTVYVQGRGVDAELGGDLRLRGTLANPTIDGGIELIRGQYRLVGQSLRFTSGRLGFDGAEGLNPSLDLEARVNVAGSTAILSVLGTTSAPRIALRGEPEMPQDEVLSRLLFGVAGGRLSPLQATRLGLAAASIAGVGERDGLGLLERARAGLGLDRLFLGTDERGAASLEGGFNITERLYLGARQGERLGELQGTARIEVTPRIRLEADIGVLGGTRAGAAYELDY